MPLGLDIYKVPEKKEMYIEQTLFSGVKTYPMTDSLGIDLYQDLGFSKVGKKNHVMMTSAVNLTINHFFQVGFFCSYVPLGVVKIDDSNNAGYELNLNKYRYCGSSFGYIPMTDAYFHPKFTLYFGLGEASGVSYNSQLNLVSSNPTSYVYYVVKPYAYLESNLLSILKWTFGAGYRYQTSSRGPTKDLEKKANGFEISTGLSLNLR